MREYSLDQVNIPRMYFQEQSADFNNKRNYLSQEFKQIVTVVSTNDADSTAKAGPAPKRPIDPSSTNESSKRLKSA